MFVGSIDSVESKSLNKLKKRKIAETTSTTKRLHTMAILDENIESEMSDSSAAENRKENSNTGDYEVSTYNKQQTANASKQVRIHLPNLAKACDRHGAAAAIMTATLCDDGIVTLQNFFEVIDMRDKIRRD